MKYIEKFNFNQLRKESIKMLIDITDSLDNHKIKYWLILAPYWCCQRRQSHSLGWRL